MFIEDLEGRQMFSVTLASPIVKPPQLAVIPTLNVSLLPVTTAAKATTAVKSAAATASLSLVQSAVPSQGAVIKPGANAAIGTVLQGTTDPNKQVGQTGTTTLPGGIVISNNPNSRPSAADLATANAFASMFGSLVNDALKALAAQYGKTLAQLTDQSVTDPTMRQDFMSTVMADLQAQTGTGQVGTVGGIDSRKADGDVPGGLGVNPTDAEVAAYIKAYNQKDQGGTAPATPAKDPNADILNSPEYKAAKDVSLFGLNMFLEKYGPPGPWLDLLQAPDVVEQVTGHASDLLNGFIAIFTSGDKNPDTHPKELTSPEGDVTLEPQQQKVIDGAMAFFARWLNAAPVPTGTSLISQPVRGDVDATPVIDKSLLTQGAVPQKDLSTIINPGSGDDGNTAVVGTAPVKTLVTVKDPPNPVLGSGGVIAPPPGSGVTPPSGGSTTPSGTTPKTPAK